MKVKHLLKELRNLYSYSQKQVADYLEVSQVTYSRYETGSREPNLDMIGKISDLYHLSILTFISATKRDLLSKENNISVIGGIFEYYRMMIFQLRNNLLVSGLVEDDNDQFVFIENSQTKQIRSTIEIYQSKMEEMSEITLEHISLKKDEQRKINENLKLIKTGYIVSESQIHEIEALKFKI